MTFHKLIILLLFVFTLSPQSNKQPEPEKESGKNSFGTPAFNIDSLGVLIRLEGWNNNYLQEYSRYLSNTEINFNKEFERLDKFTYSFEKTFLISLIYKRERKFNQMFDSLYSWFGTKVLGSNAINYLPYYEELAFAASAASLLSVLEVKAPALKTKNPLYSDYLLSLIYSSQGKYKKSLDLLLNWYNKIPENFNIAYQVSYIYRYLGNYDEALKVFTRYVKLNQPVNDWESAKILLAEGSLQFYSGNYRESEKLYKKGLEISHKINDLQEEARGYINLGIISDMYGETDNARKDYEAGISIAKKINDIDAEALGYSELGVSYSFTNELIKAKQNYELSYSLFDKEGNLTRLALLSDNLGKIYSRMFDYESAVKYFEKGIDYSGENKHAMIVNLIGLADVYTNLSNYSKAIQYYREAQEISRDIKEVSLDAQIYYGLGALNYGLNKYQNALDYFKTSFRLNNNIDTYLSAQIFNQLGLSYIEIDSLKNAKESFEQAVKFSKESRDSYSEILSCINLSYLYTKEDDYSNALKVLELTKEALNKNSFKYLKAQALLSEGKIYKAENLLQKSKKVLTEAVKIGAELREFDIQIEGNYLLAEVFEANNLNKDAESYYKSAIGLIEDVSQPLFKNEQIQIAYYSSKNEIYNSFAEFYLKQKRYKDAFELIDRSRSRNTMNNLNNLKLESLVKNDSLLKKIYDYEWILHSNIYSQEETKNAKTNYSQLKQYLIKKNPLIKRYLNVEQTLSLKEIQKNLDEDETILSTYSTKNKIYLFLIGRNSFECSQAEIGIDSLKKMVTKISPYFTYSASLQSSFYNQDLFSFNAGAAYNFYEKILSPVFTKIKPGSKVIISASPELLTLPFEFLVSKYDKTGSPYNYKGKDFLVLNYDISYTPSAAIFIGQHKNNTETNDEKVLLVGNPLINNKMKGYSERRGLLEETSGIPREMPLLPLKYSGEEVSEIGSIVKADQILTDKNATETNFKNDAGKNGIIHLSTHSFLFNKQPVIFFSNYYDPDNDGFLELGEIVQLKLKSDLVVLSSCSSGLGVIDESEGILGMTKAFFEAGAKSVVVSLWPVNDKYTSKFMTLFYKNLSKGFDKSEALRMAKIDFIKEYSPNPYYWAAFVLSGNVSKLNLKTYFNVTPFLIAVFLIILIPAALIYIKRLHVSKT